MKSKITCSGCKKKIAGIVKIITRKKKVGKKIIEETDFCCAGCFKRVNVERSWDEHRKEKASRKRKVVKKVRK